MDAVTVLGPRGTRLRARLPTTARERARGLLGRTRLDPEEAMLFAGARSVHTLGMRFPIAVAHLGRDLGILRVRIVTPWRLVLPVGEARHVLECSPEVDLRVGDRLRVAPGHAASSRHRARSSV